jgi:HK97 gp10 family phage protein
MAAGTSIEVKGLKELEAKLRELAKPQKIVRQGLRAGAKPIQKTAKALAPKQSGKLAKSIRVRAGKPNKKGRLTVIVTTSGKDNLFTGATYYGAFVELGHFTGRRLKVKGKAAYHAASLAAGRKHVPGKHFMLRAAEQAAGAAVAAFIAKLKDGIAMAMKKG